jgi:hypothetical protein
MFAFNRFSPHNKATFELDGREVPPATMLTKGVAFAVDLTLTIGTVSLLMYLLSTQVPLDTQGARTPIGLCLVLAFGFLIVGRDHLFSPGRNIFRLQLVRLPGNVPGLLGRKISVHRDSIPDTSFEPVVKGVLVVVLATALSIFSLAASLTTTRMFTTVKEYVRSNPGLLDGPVKLANMPRALLIGATRGYVQVDANVASGKTTFEFFLVRDHRQWRISAARKTAPTMSANYSLGAFAEDIPQPPTN